MRAGRLVRISLALMLVSALMTTPGMLGAAPAPAMGPVTTRISVTSAGVEANNSSYDPDMTPDGRYVTFKSGATNLVPGDTNLHEDIFVYDRVTRVIEIVSVSSSEVIGNRESSEPPSISDDGRYVAFSSDASNLVPGDTNAQADVFVRDRVKGLTYRISTRQVDSSVVEGDSYSYSPAISGDGRVVAFMSEASNLISTDTNGEADIYAKEWLTSGVCSRVSVSSSENEANGYSGEPSVSRTGRYVAFESNASNLVADTNGVQDIFVRDRAAGTTSRVSVAGAATPSDGYSYRPSISADGRFVAFESAASNLVPGDTNGFYDVFVRDVVDHQTLCASWDTGGLPASSGSHSASISDDGTFVAFASTAGDLVSGDTNGREDVFVRDLIGGATWRASVGSGGAQADDQSTGASVSADGEAVAFRSSATNLVGGDTNARTDIFVRSLIRWAPVDHDAGGVTFDRWATGFSAAYSGGGYVYSSWSGTALEFKFTGTGVKVFGPKQPNYGRVSFWLDGVSVGIADAWMAAPGTLRAELYSATDLLNGVHTLKVVCTGTKNASSTGITCVVDGFEVETNATGAVAGRFDEQGDHATFSGTWIKTSNPTYFGKTYAYSRWAGPVYSGTFFGTKVAWIGPKVNNYGKANVYVDGAFKGTVDCYSATTGWRYKIWESAALTRGSHYIYIKPTGTKQAASTNTVVVVDALDVTP